MRSLWGLSRCPFDIINDNFYQAFFFFISHIIIKAANTSIKKVDITATSEALIILSNNIPQILAIIKSSISRAIWVLYDDRILPQNPG